MGPIGFYSIVHINAAELRGFSESYIFALKALYSITPKLSDSRLKDRLNTMPQKWLIYQRVEAFEKPPIHHPGTTQAPSCYWP